MDHILDPKPLSCATKDISWLGQIHAHASQTARGLETQQYAKVGSILIRHSLRSHGMLLDNGTAPVRKDACPVSSGIFSLCALVWPLL